MAAGRTAWRVLWAAQRDARESQITDAAAAISYYAFLAIPALALIVVGIFGATAGPGAVDSITANLNDTMPAEAVTLIDDTLQRVIANGRGAGAAGLAGGLLALWTASGAMNALMRGLVRMRGEHDGRNFARQRAVAAAMLGWVLLALTLMVALFLMGPVVSDSLGRWSGRSTLVDALWASARWPLLVGGLYLAVAGLLKVGSGRPRLGRGPAAAGAAATVTIWLVVSAGFSLYTSRFASYGATWGSLSAVIVMLTWLWLSGLAVLFGGQVGHQFARRHLDEEPAASPPQRSAADRS